jgi:hypothetical protein
MGKKHTKTEKLDLILSELSELKGEIKKLRKDRGADTELGIKTQSKSPPAQRGKRATKRPANSKKLNKNVAPSKPVLVPTTPGAATG